MAALVSVDMAAGLMPGDKPLYAQEKGPTGVANAAATDAHSADRAAIGAAMQSFAKAFGAGDAKSLAGHWTAEGEYQNDAGVSVRGRAALESQFATFFTRAPEPKADVQPESLRFLADDLAIGEGVVTVRRGPAEPEGRAQYSVTFVRDGDRWRIAQLRESARHGTSVEDIAWLIGSWKSVINQGAEIQTTYAWTRNKKFIHATFTLKEKELSLSGDQVIGVDPATGSLCSWTFEANGGVGEADWERDGDHWVLRSVGTLADGRTLTQTNVLRRINQDTLTWQSVDRSLDDADLPDLPPIKMVRSKPAN
jgi:uncharacterized protein (TIGR02246 family)